VVFVFHAMKSASGLQVAKLGIDCFVGRAYFFLSNVQVRGTNCTGFNNRKEIGRALQKQGISKDHTQGLLKFKLFGRKQQNIANVLDNAHRKSVIEYNPKVTENRETLGRLIDITIYLGTQELAFGGHNENENSFNEGNFRELAKLLSGIMINLNNF
jgi:hypothetical protein